MTTAILALASLAGLLALAVQVAEPMLDTLPPRTRGRRRPREWPPK